MKRAFHIMGSPGSGKGTQANLLADHLYAIHFDTGKYLERIIKEGDPLVTPEFKKQFNTGILNTPEIVLKLVKKEVGGLAKAGLTLIFSGSPRTLYEAFGNRKNEGLMPFLVRLYSKRNVTILKLKVSNNASLKRNSIRLVCSICKKPSINPKLTHCSICGGKLYRRTLDKPEVIKERLREYSERTEPIFKELKKRKFRIIEIDGTKMPSKVFESIKKHL